MRRHWSLIAAAAVMSLFFFSSMFSASHDLVQVPAFNGKTLAGWHTLGNGDWRAANGEIVGSGPGGWLVLDRIYQDTVLDLSFLCKGCTTGVLLRSLKDGDRTTGVYVSLSGEDVGRIYRVTLDAQGQEVDRTPFETPPPSPAGGDIAKGGCAPVPCVGITGAHGGAMSTGGSRQRAGGADQCALR